MNYIVNFKKIESMKIVYVRGIVDTYADAGELWTMLERKCKEQDVNPIEPIYSMCIYHDKGYQKNDVDMSVAIKVDEIKKENNYLRFKEVEEMEVASITFKGDYSQMHNVNREIGLWIKENNYEIVGENFVVLHKGPYNTENIGEYITEVCYPIKKKVEKTKKILKYE